VILGHHWNQKATIQRAAEAKAWGLLPMDWMLPSKDWPTPFTQQNITISGDVSPGRWIRWAVATILLTVLGGGGFLCWPQVSRWWASERVQQVEKVDRVERVEKVLRGDADIESGEVTVEHRR
jgi:hypothetical protein